MITKHDSSTRVLTIVLTVAFALISLVIAYAAFTGGSFDLRSKAATHSFPLKTWEFTSSDEGWKALDVGTTSVSQRKYSIDLRQDASLKPRLENDALDFTLLYPRNRIDVQLTLPKLVITPTPTPACTPLPRQCPRNNKPCQFTTPGVTYCSQSEPGRTGGGIFNGSGRLGESRVEYTQVPIQISYRLKGSSSYEKLKLTRARASGESVSIRADLPSGLSLKKLDGISISFQALPALSLTHVDVSQIMLVRVEQDTNSTTTTPSTSTTIPAIDTTTPADTTAPTACKRCASSKCGQCSTTAANWRCVCTTPMPGGYASCRGVSDQSCAAGETDN